MVARNVSLGGGVEQQTRCSYALIGTPTGANCIPLRDRNKAGVTTTSSLRSQRLGSDAASQPVVGGRRVLITASKRRLSGTPGVAEFQYKYSNGRLDSG